MKVIGIVGSRRRDSWEDSWIVKEAFLDEYDEGDEIVSGGCPRGADRFAEQIAREMQVPIKIYYAPWARKGRSAGFYRNTIIAQEATILIACVADDRTGGTEDTIKKFHAKKSGGKVRIV